MKLTKPREGIGGTLWLGEGAYQGRALELYATPDNHRLQHLNLVFGDMHGNRDFHISVGLRYLYLFFGTEGFIPWSLRRKVYQWAQKNAREEWYAYQLDPFDGRNTGISFHDGSVWLKLWSNDQAWSCRDKEKPPWLTNGWEWHWSWKDFLLGEPQYEELKVHEAPQFVVMPEGRYPAKVTQTRVRWRRRFGLGRRWLWRAEVEVKEGIPIPGKGSTCYNQGDTARTSTSFPVQRKRMFAWQACQKLASSCLKTRQRYDGLDFVPKEGWPDHMIPHH